jgi:hypothetical protein
MKPIGWPNTFSGAQLNETWPTNEDMIIWPEFVHINNRFYDLYNYTMHEWLRENIGYKSFDWNIFFNSNRVEYRFTTIQDRAAFALRWTYQ